LIVKTKIAITLICKESALFQNTEFNLTDLTTMYWKGVDFSKSSIMSECSVYYDEQDQCLRGFRDSIILTEKILKKISGSIQTFRPSKSLAELSSPRSIVRTLSPEPIAEIDVVISGGGMKCYYVAGISFP
jgi:hypothetical protein